ncbi:MAG TPA: DUF5615 family PIN-like protein [Tepidiformaceae bacterium]|nr:DUF5615 family PIN-like protein [Tepidiformaceae bacterium]
MLRASSWSGRLRVLLDECVPRRLKAEIAGHDVRTVHDERWLGVGDGEMLRRADGRFDVIVTVDQGLPHQHQIARYSFAVVVLQARHNRYRDLAPLVPPLLNMLATLAPGTAVTVSENDSALA